MYLTNPKVIKYHSCNLNTIPFLEDILWESPTVGNGALTIRYAIAIHVFNNLYFSLEFYIVKGKSIRVEKTFMRFDFAKQYNPG